MPYVALASVTHTLNDGYSSESSMNGTGHIYESAILPFIFSI